MEIIDEREKEKKTTKKQTESSKWVAQAIVKVGELNGFATRLS